MKLPPLTQLRQDETHRLVPSKYALEEQGPLSRLTDGNSDLRALRELERSTDNRVLGESGLLPGIGIHELVFGVSYAHIVNAAFTYAHPGGSRFNGPERGAWYAAFRLETSQAEVAFHRGRELQEINWPHAEIFEYVEYLADFRAEFHDIRKASEFRDCLAPDSYARLAKACAGAFGARISRDCLSERAREDARRLPYLLSASARHECSERDFA